MDNQIHVTQLFEDGTKRTQLYSRYITEKNLERELSRDEAVIHIDGNKMNYSLDNLKIISRAEQLAARAAARPGKVNLTLEDRVANMMTRRVNAGKSDSDSFVSVDGKSIPVPAAKKKKAKFSGPRTYKMAAFLCSECHKPAQRRASEVIKRQKQGLPIFCSMPCAGAYNYRANPLIRVAFEKSLARRTGATNDGIPAQTV